MASLSYRNKTHKYPAVIGTDFRFSPVGNHKHPQIQKAGIKGEVFAKEYVKHFNATWAEEKVRSNFEGFVLTPKNKFGHLIDKELKKMGEIAKNKGITPEQVIDELAQIAFNNDGKFNSTDSLKVSVDHKLKALDMLAKYLGLYEKDNLQKASDTQVLQIAFVGADYAETQAKLAETQKAVKADSIDTKPALVKRTKELKARLTKGKSLDLSGFRE